MQYSAKENVQTVHPRTVTCNTVYLDFRARKQQYGPLPVLYGTHRNQCCWSPRKLCPLCLVFCAHQLSSTALLNAEEMSWELRPHLGKSAHFSCCSSPLFCCSYFSRKSCSPHPALLGFEPTPVLLEFVPLFLSSRDACCSSPSDCTK